MRKIKIITDSTADLNKDIVKLNDIKVMPLKVSFTDQTYNDGVDIDTETLYRLVDEKKELPKTSAISPGEFIIEFEKWLDLGYDILYIGIGSTISGTFQSANLAKETLGSDSIQLVDSLNLSSGIGLLVLKAIEYRNQGLSVIELKDKITELVPKVSSQFAIQVLDYLHKGGRASGTTALVGKVLRVRPIIKVKNGILDVYKKPMGTMTKAVTLMLEEFIEAVNQDNVDLENVMITHSLNEKQAIYMKEYVESRVKVENLIISNAGCVISSHCGKGTIGILYILKDENK